MVVFNRLHALQFVLCSGTALFQGIYTLIAHIPADGEAYHAGLGEIFHFAVEVLPFRDPVPPPTPEQVTNIDINRCILELLAYACANRSESKVLRGTS